MTIKDIAKESGCAIGTVSRVLNNHPDVSKETRKKVQEVVDKYGFVLNRNAKLLKEQDSKTIVIFVKGSSSPLLNSLLEIIQKLLEPLVYNTLVYVLDEYDDESKAARRVYFEHKPLGMIFLGGNPEHDRQVFEDVKVPCVLISNQAETHDFKNLSSVSTDDIQAAFACTEYLLKNGHKKIGVIGGDLESSEMTQRRYTGFIEAMDRYNYEFDRNSYYQTAKYSFEGGSQACQRLLQKSPDITAIFTMSDVMAIGACRKLAEMGYNVPNDVSVVGFDGLPYTQYYIPKITTILQLTQELADKGLQCLLDCIENKQSAKHILIPFEFLEGESVRKI